MAGDTEPEEDYRPTSILKNSGSRPGTSESLAPSSRPGTSGSLAPPSRPGTAGAPKLSPVPEGKGRFNDTVHVSLI